MRRVAGIALAGLGAALALAGCGSQLTPLTADGSAAITYAPTGSVWDIRAHGRFELTAEGCLVINGKSNQRPTVLAGVPVGTTMSEDGVTLPGLPTIALGDSFAFSQEPFHGTGADLPTAEPVTSGLPEGCDPSLDVVLIVPIADA